MGEGEANRNRSIKHDYTKRKPNKKRHLKSKINSIIVNWLGDNNMYFDTCEMRGSSLSCYVVDIEDKDNLHVEDKDNYMLNEIKKA